MNDNQPELKPCPYCGCIDLYVTAHRSLTERLYVGVVHCKICHARLPEFERPNRTVRSAMLAAQFKWNRRAGE